MVQRIAALAYLDKNENLDQQDFVKINLEEYYPQLQLDPSIKQSCLVKYGLKDDDKEKYLVFAPGAAYGDTKKWPEEYFASVAVNKIQQGFKIVLLGSEKDRVTSDNIAYLIHSQLHGRSSNECLNLAGMLELVETVAIIAEADAIVSNDSGLLHVAASVNTPLIGIYGSTSPDFTPPLIKDSKKVILTVENLNCRPCFQKTCRYRHLKCLRDLHPPLVNHAIDNICAS